MIAAAGLVHAKGVGLRFQARMYAVLEWKSVVEDVFDNAGLSASVAFNRLDGAASVLGAPSLSRWIHRRIALSGVRSSWETVARLAFREVTRIGHRHGPIAINDATHRELNRELCSAGAPPGHFDSCAVRWNLAIRVRPRGITWRCFWKAW